MASPFQFLANRNLFIVADIKLVNHAFLFFVASFCQYLCCIAVDEKKSH